jgi:uncharacterized protein (DUF427 family)
MARMVDRIEPGPGQESVWDYPRPPRLEHSGKHVVVRFAGEGIADTRHAIRILETSSPPTWYVAPEDVHTSFLSPAEGTTFCEWKGTATYYDLRAGEHVSRRAAWTYLYPSAGFEEIAGWISFYPGRVGEATINGEVVRPQPGRYYGGWVTDEIVGPFKGDPGSESW